MAADARRNYRIQSAIANVRALIVGGNDPASFVHAIRTALAAVMSLVIARLTRLPEPYWAPISTLVIMQSTLGASLRLSVQRFAGTALGAAIGGLVDRYYAGNAFSFTLCVFLIGSLCAVLRIDRPAYRYASISLAIVMLVGRANTGMIVALHRFVEVSIGIAAGLAISAIWPEKQGRAASNAGSTVARHP